MESNWRIRQAEESEVQLYIEWANKEGWMVRAEITRGFYQEFPHGWFLCELLSESTDKPNSNGEKPEANNHENKRVIGLVHGMKYRSQVGFIGDFIVDPEYRGQGYGQKLFQHVLDNYLFQDNEGGPQVKAVGLFALEKAVSFYKRHGFKREEESYEFKGILNRDLLESSLNLDGNLSSRMTEGDLEEVALLDEKYSLAYRPGFWRNWMNGERKSLEKADDKYSSVLHRDANGNLRGMGMLKGVAQNGRYLLRLGPVYAENLDIFKAVVTKMLSKVNSKDAIDISADVLCGNKEACEWYEKSLGLEKVLTTIYMWKGDFSLNEENVKKTYALTSLDFH